MKKAIILITIGMILILILISPLSVVANDSQAENDYFMDMWRAAEATVTPKEIADAERIIIETKQFFENLTKQDIWREYLKENKDIYYIRQLEKFNLMKEIETLYGEITINNTINSSLTGMAVTYTTYFSNHDGASNGDVVTLYNTRWKTNALIRSPYNSDVTQSRQQTIWNNKWYRPL